MIDQASIDTPAAADWPDLVDEFDRWETAGRVAVLWWRDDDAVAATPQLDLLLRLAGEVPIALAVIPALARPELADALACRPPVAVLQHGWRHANRAAGGRKSEYPQGRSAAMVRAEIAAGQARLKALFGPRALPVLVPPWNRFAAEYLPLLPDAGMMGLSAMASSHPAAALPADMARLDVHVDLVAWRGDRGFVGTAAALGGLVGRLRASRQADGAAPPPIGILTHHLIMDGATAAFLDRLTATARGHAAIRWAGAPEMLQ
jgi:hypothetical protein